MDAGSLLIALYFLPALAGLLNGGASVGDKLAAFVLNVMFGWTVVGWFVVFCYATSDHKGAARLRQAQANFYLREDAKHSAS
jgi:Superinfection immunity protein